MANAPIGQKNRPYRSRISVKNGEATLPILSGMPVVYPINFTDDGFNVVRSESVTSQKVPLVAGIAEVTLKEGQANPGEYFDVIVGGFAPNVRLLRGTRAASTDAWPTFAAVSVGDFLSVSAPQNALVRSSAGGATNYPGQFVFAGNPKATNSTGLNFASAATAASDAYPEVGDGLIFVTTAKALVRSL